VLIYSEPQYYVLRDHRHMTFLNLTAHNAEDTGMACVVPKAVKLFSF